jgi:tight adherence protein C
VISLALVGALIGVLLFALVWQLLPPRQSALVGLGRFDAQFGADSVRELETQASNDVTGQFAGLQLQLGKALADYLQRRGVTYTSLRQDLALTGRSYQAAMARKAVSFIAGFLLVVLLSIALAAGAGFTLPFGTPALLALIAGAAFFMLPDVEARREATDRRRDFRRAFGAYLDLVALEMAGSAAPTEALPTAARVGSGWPLALLRDTLFRATAAGQDQWQALSELGERIGVPELRDLGALVRLVGQDGAQIRETLTARAASMRRRELAESEGEASERDQSMRMAQLVIGFGFILFITYPAIVVVMDI